MSATELLNNWKLNKGQGQVLLDNTIEDINLKEATITLLVDTLINSNRDNKIVYITLDTVSFIKPSTNLEILYITNMLFGSQSDIVSKYIILDTKGMSVLQLENIRIRLKNKFIFILVYKDEDIRYYLNAPLLNREDTDYVYENKAVELSEEELEKYNNYTEYIDDSMSKFNLDDKDLNNLAGVNNMFTLIHACSRGIKRYVDGQFVSNEPTYYRRYLAELMGWSPTLDLSIPFFKDIHDSFNPAMIGEVSNTILNIMQERNSLLKELPSKVNTIADIVKANPNKKILIIAANTSNAEVIHDKLNAAKINNREYHNNLKGVFLYDEFGEVITYKTGANKGLPKPHGATTVKANNVEEYNRGIVNVLIVAGKLNKVLDIKNVDIVIINKVDIDYKNIYRSNFIKFPFNKVINTIFIYANKTKDINKLKNVYYSNNIKINKQRGIIKNNIDTL